MNSYMVTWRIGDEPFLVDHSDPELAWRHAQELAETSGRHDIRVTSVPVYFETAKARVWANLQQRLQEEGDGVRTVAAGGSGGRGCRSDSDGRAARPRRRPFKGHPRVRELSLEAVGFTAVIALFCVLTVVDEIRARRSKRQ